MGNPLSRSAANQSWRIVTAPAIALLLLFIGVPNWKEGQVEQFMRDSSDRQAKQLVDRNLAHLYRDIKEPAEEIKSALSKAIGEYFYQGTGEASRNAALGRIGSLSTALGYQIRIADKRGQVIYGAAGFSSNVSRYAFFARAASISGHAAVTLETIEGQLFLIFVHRVSAPNGGFLGAVFVATPVSRWQELLQGNTQHGEVALLSDENGKVLLRNQDSVLVDDGMDLGMKVTGYYRKQNPVNGTEWLFARKAVAGGLVTIAVGVPVSQYQAQHDIAIDVIGTALFVLLLYVLTVLVRRRIIADAKRYEDLQEHEEAYRAVFEGAPLGMELVALDGEVVKVNQALCRILGRSSSEITGHLISEIMHPDDIGKEESICVEAIASTEPVQVETRYLRPDSSVIWVQRTIVCVRGEVGNPIGYVNQVEDITARKAHQEHLRDLAYYDTLTKLPNRRMLMEELRLSVARTHERNQIMALMFIDLDGFKKVNDTLGHDVGDELLKEAAHRLSTCIRGDDMVARQGGDEFVVILKNMSGIENAELVAQKIVYRMQQPVELPEHTVNVSASIGIAIVSQGNPDNETVDTLMKKADAAMYQTKQRGRNGHTVFEPGMAS